MKRYWIFVLSIAAVVALSLVINQSFAQDRAAKSAEARAAVCDLEQIFRDYEKAKDLSKEGEEKRAQLSTEDDARTKAILKIEKELPRLKAGTKEYDNRLNEMSELAANRDSWREVQKKKLALDAFRKTDEMYQSIIKMIETTAKSRNLDLVFFKENNDRKADTIDQLLQQIAGRKLLYSSNSIDITDEVLIKLNEEYKVKK